ncbi:acyl-CoA dehydrogenase family member 10-like [Argonauta hians]
MLLRVVQLKRVLAPVWRTTPRCVCTSGVLGQRSGRHDNIRCVIFDMGGVILPNPTSIFQEFESSHDLPEGLLLNVIKSRGESGSWAMLERGVFTSSEFVHKFNQECSQEIGRPVDVSELLPKFHYSPDVIPFPQMLDLIQCVRAEGYLTALLTNNWLIHPSHSFLPLDRSLFDVIVESAVVKYRKPDPRIYETCLKQLRLNPHQAVFLDDLGVNLKAAKQLGIETIKVESPSQAVSDLESLLGVSLQGYLPGTVSVPPRLHFSREALCGFLVGELGLGDSGTLPHVRLFKHGMSNPTFYIKFGSQELVVRKKPPGKLLPSAHAVDREYRVMKAMGQHGVPVPPMLGLCTDPSIVGTQFYVMGLVRGTVYLDPLLPGLTSDQRHHTYMAMVDTLSHIHSVDIAAAGLGDFGKTGGYMKRNFQRWVTQYNQSKTEEISAMDEMIAWISDNLPDTDTTTVVHGDYRLDNIIYSPEGKVLAVLDWELSTLGDPLSDLATCCFMYYLPSTFPILHGLSDLPLAQYGIPTIDEVLQRYTTQRNLPPIHNWSFYVTYTFFRFAAILQGVYKRATVGQSTNTQAETTGKYVKMLAQLGVQQIRSNNNNNNNNNRILSASSRQKPGNLGDSSSGSSSSRAYSTTTTTADTTTTAAAAHMLPLSLSGVRPHVKKLHGEVEAFIQDHILPLEDSYVRHSQSSDRWHSFQPLEALKTKARAAGLWNLFLPVSIDPSGQYGPQLTNVEYSFLCELMGSTVMAPEVFNCSAPDTGNMEVLVKYGTEEQQRQWLQPLLDGTIRSCFAMTEPQVASSDATNIESSIVRDGDHYILNGHKWWTSGAMDSRCAVCIFMGKTDPAAAKHQQQSMVLVPMATKGVTVVRPLSVFGYDDAPVGHGEVLFEDVRVPVQNLLLGEGRGFEIAQGRLGPGRIHHCMRLIGMAERALALMVDRSRERVVFGKPLCDQGVVQASIGQSRIEIEQARLLVLKAAHMMDNVGSKAAAGEIAMIKVIAPNMAARVIDRAIQVHGGAGLHSDLPLASMYAWARILRLADGPDEVHTQSVARLELKRRVRRRR